MGDNNGFQLGDGTTDSGKFYTNSPEQIVSSNVVAIAGGDQHSLFLKSNGSLWAMGFNYNGQLGDGTKTDSHSPVPIAPAPPVPVILGWNFSRTDLTIYATNGLAGGTYYVLMSTSAALPLSQWAQVATSVPVANGNFTLTTSNAFAPNVSQRFYTLQLLR